MTTEFRMMYDDAIRGNLCVGTWALAVLEGGIECIPGCEQALVCHAIKAVISYIVGERSDDGG